MIFHSYVSLPEGKTLVDSCQAIPKKFTVPRLPRHEAQLLHHRAALLEEADAAEKGRGQLRHRGQRDQELHRHQWRGQGEANASHDGNAKRGMLPVNYGYIYGYIYG